MNVGSPIATIPPCDVTAPTPAAGVPVRKVGIPITIGSTGGTPAQVAIAPIPARGKPITKNVGSDGKTMGPPTCGTGGMAGVVIGQACMLPRKATGPGIVLQEIVETKQQKTNVSAMALFATVLT